ncbi:hypothetical protein VTN02DRAFT_4527 [Thermoascus thermophilus]
METVVGVSVSGSSRASVAEASRRPSAPTCRRRDVLVAGAEEPRRFCASLSLSESSPTCNDQPPLDGRLGLRRAPPSRGSLPLCLQLTVLQSLPLRSEANCTQPVLFLPLRTPRRRAQCHHHGSCQPPRRKTPLRGPKEQVPRRTNPCPSLDSCVGDHRRQCDIQQLG